MRSVKVRAAISSVCVVEGAAGCVAGGRGRGARGRGQGAPVGDGGGGSM